MIEILSSGLANSVQDLGRPGFLDQGIGRGGVMDRPALRIANRLVGNAEGAAGLEIAVFPFRLRFHAPCRFAVTGCRTNVSLNGAPVPIWWSHQAEAGDELRLDPPGEGARAVIAVSGGFSLPEVLGSRATDLKSVFGGLEGRALGRGDRVAIGAAAGLAPRSPAGLGADPAYFRPHLGGRPGGAPVILRVMAGAEFGEFIGSARDAIASADYTVSQENNRQGMRLDGPKLELAERLELHSHGIMPGTIQVPPSGQPVIQLAEANTCGGYPKIAHVIEPDQWMLAQAPSGSALRFRLVDRHTAVAAIKDEERAMARFANLLPMAMTERTT